MQTKSFLGALDHERIVKAIQDAEARSRGEVRVHVSQKAVADAEAAAARQFEALGMTQTAERNGVLLFVAPVSQTFAVVGDEGIHDALRPATSGRTWPPRWRRTSGPAASRTGSSRAWPASATRWPRTSRARRAPRTANELPDEVTED